MSDTPFPTSALSSDKFSQELSNRGWHTLKTSDPAHAFVIEDQNHRTVGYANGDRSHLTFEGLPNHAPAPVAPAVPTVPTSTAAGAQLANNIGQQMGEFGQRAGNWLRQNYGALKGNPTAASTSPAGASVTSAVNPAVPSMAALAEAWKRGGSDPNNVALEVQKLLKKAGYKLEGKNEGEDRKFGGTTQIALQKYIQRTGAPDSGRLVQALGIDMRGDSNYHEKNAALVDAFDKNRDLFPGAPEKTPAAPADVAQNRPPPHAAALRGSHTGHRYGARVGMPGISPPAPT